MIPLDTVVKAARLVEDCERAISEWSKAKDIYKLSIYYNGHPANDVGDDDMVERVRQAIISARREVVYDKIKKLRELNIDVDGMLPEDWA